jgi:hypothetical protein
MPNPGFDITSSGAYSYEPIGWQLSGYAGARYENNGNGDGQFIADAIPVFGSTPTPTTPTGTGSGSVDAFVRSQAESGTAASDDNAKIIATVDPGPVSGTLSQINISAYDGNYIAATESLWAKNNSGNYVELELTAALKPGDKRVFFTSVNIGSDVSYIYGKNSGYAYSASETNIDQDEYLNFSAQFLPTLKGDTASIPTNSYAQLRAAYYQIKLSNGSSTYYLKQSTGFYQWTTDVYWLTRSVAENDWNNIEFTIWDKTPISGQVTVTIGPAIDTRQVSILTENNVASFDELRWDNVDVRPILNPLNPNAESTGTIVFDDAQTTEVVSVREVPVRIGDAPYNPCRFGMSLDSDGLLQTANWSEDPIGVDAESGLSHEGLLGTAVLRSLRAPRETHSATYFGLSETLGCWHVISRGGSEYAPKSITTQWNRSNTSGTWYKVTESGFISDTAIIKGSAAFVSSRGGVGESSARFFQNIGNALFADGSTAITRTDSPISAGTVTSISIESIVEPIFKSGDLISIMGPDLSFVQARISADQDALATTLSIEDKDSPGTGVTFAQEMPSPAAVYFLEQELLTLARLGEQGFAVTVLGENLGTINETKSGLYTTLNVTNWGISVKTGAEVYIEQSDDTLVKVTLSADAPKGSTSISFASASIDVTAGDRVKPSGTVNRADFQVTADAITAYLGNPGDVIATLSADSTWDGTRTTLPCSGGTSEDLEAKDPVLIYTQLGSVVKGIVNVDTASGATSIVLSSTSGNLTASAKSGDKVVPGSVTGLRIDMDGIEVRADEIRSDNYNGDGTSGNPGTAGWLIGGSGDAFFGSIYARGSIILGAGSDADWSYITGTNKPDDNATQGATWGVNIVSQPTDAAILNAQQIWSEISGTGKPEDNATLGADWDSNVDNLPDGASSLKDDLAPRTGLNLTNTYLGYYDGSNWKTFMEGTTGNFYLGGTSGSLVWSGGTLEITGSITAESGYIGTSASGFSINSDYFANGKTSLTDANTGVYVGTDGISLGASSVFKVTDAGVLTASSATISGSFNVSTDISIDSSGILIQSGSGNVNKIRWSDGAQIYSGGGSGVMTISPATSLAIVASGGTLFNPGNIRLVNTTAPAGQASTASIYSVSGDLYTKNGTGTGYKILTAESGQTTTFNDTEFQTVDGGTQTEYRQRTITVTNGQITAVGAFGAWTAVVVN